MSRQSSLKAHLAKRDDKGSRGGLTEELSLLCSDEVHISLGVMLTMLLSLDLLPVIGVFLSAYIFQCSCHCNTLLLVWPIYDLGSPGVDSVRTGRSCDFKLHEG